MVDLNWQGFGTEESCLVGVVYFIFWSTSRDGRDVYLGRGMPPPKRTRALTQHIPRVNPHF